MREKIVRYLLNAPISVIVLISAVLLIIWGSLGNVEIKGVHIALESPARYIVIAIGVLLIPLALIVSRAEQLDRLPIKAISIKDSHSSLTPYPQVRLTGEVTPKKPRVRVWFFRQDPRRIADFNLSVGHATTDDNGDWEQTVSLWLPGPFDIYAVVTTQESENFFRLHQRAFDAALKVRRQQDPNTYSVPGWPNLDALPKLSVSAVRRVTL